MLLIPPRFEELEITDQSVPKPNEKRVGLFSSGSTGTPKCIWNSLGNLKQNGALSINMFRVTPEDRILIIASPWHVAGISWSLMAEQAGAEYRTVTPSIDDAKKWPDLIRSYRPTHLMTVPSVLRYLYEDENWHVPRISYGGASIQPGEYSKLERHCERLFQGYGQTEAGGLIAVHERGMDRPQGTHEHQCCGYPPDEFTITCEGTPESPDAIILESPTSIYNKPYNTGDLGFRDSKKRLHVTGRNDDTKGNCNMITAVTSVMHK